MIPHAFLLVEELLGVRYLLLLPGKHDLGGRVEIRQIDVHKPVLGKNRLDLFLVRARDRGHAASRGLGHQFAPFFHQAQAGLEIDRFGRQKRVELPKAVPGQKVGFFPRLLEFLVIRKGVHHIQRRLRVLGLVEFLVGILKADFPDGIPQNLVRFRSEIPELLEQILPHPFCLGTLSRKDESFHMHSFS